VAGEAEDVRLPDMDMEAVEQLSRIVRGDPSTIHPRERRQDPEAPYDPWNRPAIRQQLNDTRRWHPDWPEEWYVRVPRSLVTWNPDDLTRWGMSGRPKFAAFPSAEEAETFAQQVWRETWKGRIGKDAVITVNRERVFVYDAARSASGRSDLEALRTWQASGSQAPGAILVMRHTALAPTGERFDLDLGAEESRTRWLEEFANKPGAAGEGQVGVVYFDPMAFDRAGYAGFLETARAVWRGAQDLGGLGRELRAAVTHAVAALREDIEAAMEHELPRTSRARGGAPVLPEFAEFEHWLARQSEGRTGTARPAPVERAPSDFQRALDKAWELSAALPETDATSATVRGIRVNMRRLTEQALAFRSREVGIYSVGHVSDVVIHSFEEDQTGLATDNRLSAVEDSRLFGATRLPSGKFIVWRASTAGVDDGLHPLQVREFPFRSLEDAKRWTNGLPLTVIDSEEAIDRWKATARDQVMVRREMTPARTRATSAVEASEAEPAQPIRETRWATRIAPLGPGRSVLFAEDTWGLEKEPVLVREDPATQGLVPLRGDDKGQPVVVTGETFADRMVEAQVRWPDVDVVASDLPQGLARTLATRYDLAAERVGVYDALWHVAPAGNTTPAVAVAWTYQAVRTGEGTDLQLRPQVLKRVEAGRPVLVRFPGATASDAVRAGHEYMSANGAAADVTRRIPRVVTEAVHKTVIAIEMKAGKETSLRPSDPFEVFGRQTRLEKGRALKAVPEGARDVVEAASLGLQPRELAGPRGTDAEVVSAQYRVAERALADHFAKRPELAEHGPAPKLTGLKPRL